MRAGGERQTLKHPPLETREGARTPTATSSEFHSTGSLRQQRSLLRRLAGRQIARALQPSTGPRPSLPESPQRRPSGEQERTPRIYVDRIDLDHETFSECYAPRCQNERVSREVTWHADRCFISRETATSPVICQRHQPGEVKSTSSVKTLPHASSAIGDVGVSSVESSSANMKPNLETSLATTVPGSGFTSDVGLMANSSQRGAQSKQGFVPRIACRYNAMADACRRWAPPEHVTRRCEIGAPRRHLGRRQIGIAHSNCGTGRAPT